MSSIHSNLSAERSSYRLDDAGSLTTSRATNGIAAADAAYRGQNVQINDTPYSLTDAAEELSMHFGEKVESEKDNDREVDAEDCLALLPEDNINAYLDASKHNDEARRRELIEALLSGRIHDIREKIAQSYPNDPTLQFLVLHAAVRYGQRRSVEAGNAGNAPAPHLIQRLLDVAADLELAHGAHILADLNVISVATGQDVSADDVKRFQREYRDVVLGKGTLSATLKIVLGDEAASADINPKVALTRLMQALGQDLSANRPSIDPIRLHALMQDKFLAETALSVLERCAALPGEPRHPSHTQNDAQKIEQAYPQRALSLMRSVVALSEERWPAVERFEKLTIEQGGAHFRTRIPFLTGFRSIASDLPVQVFASDVRPKVLQVLQEALDALIERSEVEGDVLIEPSQIEGDA